MIAGLAETTNPGFPGVCSEDAIASKLCSRWAFEALMPQRLEGSPAGNGSLLRQCGKEFQ